MNDEEWKDIDGYTGYQVSNLGRVKSLVKPYRRKDKVLKGSPNSTGYMLVQLYAEPCVRKSLLIHRLVMLTFQPNPAMDELEVNHKDLNINNNNMSNLEWVTPEVNKDHYWNTVDLSKRLPTPRGESHHLSVMTDEKVLELRRIWKDSKVRIYKKTLMEMFGISRGNLDLILNGHTWKHLL